MAENTQTLFDEIGLGGRKPDPQASAYERREQRQTESAAAGANAIGGMIGSLFGKNKGRTLREGFKAGLEQQNLVNESRATGLSVQETIKRKAVRKSAQDINVPSTGDAIADQLALLKELSQLADREGDTQLIANINRKRMQLKVQQAELSKMEGTESREKSEEQRTADDFQQAKYTGVDVVPTGADVKSKDFVPSSAIYDPDTGLWTVTHRDGSTEEVTSIQKYDPAIHGPNAGGRQRVSESAQSEAIKQSGTGKAYAAKKTNLTNMAKVAGITTDVVDLFTSLVDPQAALAYNANISIVTDKLIRTGESAARLFRGKSGDMTYIHQNGGTFRNDQYVVNGKVTSKLQQKGWALKKIEEGIEALGGMSALFPAIKQNSAAASKMKAMIMEMAFMDARMQEPSNRGLSDKDIEAALERIGAFSANPTVFIDRQLQLANRNLHELDILGEEYNDTPNNTKEDLIKATYNFEQVARVRDTLNKNIARMIEARATIEQRLGATQQAPSASPTGNPLEALTPEELDARIKAEQAKEGQ